MDKKSKNILRYCFWTAIAVVLVWLCLRSISWQEFLSALQLCKWEYMLIALACGALFVWLRGLRWHMLLKPIDPAIRQSDVVSAYGIGYLVNLAVPRAGEVVKMGYVVKHSKVAWDAVIGTFVVERGVDAVVTAGLILAFLAGNWSSIGSLVSVDVGSATMIWATLALIVLSIVFLVLCYVLRGKGGIWGKIWGFIAGIGRGLGSFRQMERPWLFLFYTAVVWFSHWLASAAVIWALQDIEPFTVLRSADAFNLMVAGSLSTIIPVPGGFGAYHGAVATVMQALNGIPLGSGMIYATLNHESQVLAQMVAGIWGYIHQTFFRSK